MKFTEWRKANRKCVRGVGKEVTLDEYNAYREELKVFQRWFDENIFSQDPNTLSDAIMIMPYGSANPKYRDIANESFPIPRVFHFLRTD